MNVYCVQNTWTGELKFFSDLSSAERFIANMEEEEPNTWFRYEEGDF